jgi:hypothetical protein
VERLRSQLDELGSAAAEPISAQQCGRVSELMADLKGKFCSALMGATASIVAEGQWSGVEVEPILFPEKAEEFKRNDELVTSLRGVLESIAKLPGEICFEELLERWRQGLRVDQYALTDLSSLRGRLGGLLKSSSRRALYSGDYHQVRRRESLLSQRINELERLHQLTWDSSPSGSDAQTAFPRLVQLILEIVAILDTGLLESLVGEKQVKDLLAIVSSEKSAAAVEEAATPMGEGPGTPEVEPKGEKEQLRALVPLLYEEDLRTFLELIMGAVLKRASFSVVGQKEPPAVEDPLGLGDLEVESADPGLLMQDGEPEWMRDFSDLELELEEPAGVRPVEPQSVFLVEPESVAEAEPESGLQEGARPGAEEAPGTLSDVAEAEPTPDREAEELVALEQLAQLLSELQSPSNRDWSNLRMLQRLLAKHPRVPPAMVQSVGPYLHELLNALIPRLERVTSFGAVPGEAMDQVVRYCVALTKEQITPEQMHTQVRENLTRLLRLLDALRAAVAEQVRSRQTPAGNAVN